MNENSRRSFKKRLINGRSLSLFVTVIVAFLLITSVSTFSNAQVSQEYEKNVVSKETNSYLGPYTIVHPPSVVLTAFQDLASEAGSCSIGAGASVVSSNNAFLISWPGVSITGENLTEKTLVENIGTGFHGLILGASDGSQYNTTIGIVNVTLHLPDKNISDAVYIVSAFLFFTSLSATANVTSNSSSPPSPLGYRTWTQTIGASTSVGLWWMNNSEYQYNMTLWSFNVTITLVYSGSTLEGGSVQIWVKWLNIIDISPGHTSPFYGAQFNVADSDGWQYNVYPAYSNSMYGYINDTAVSYDHQDVTFYVNTHADWGVADDDSYIYVSIDLSEPVPD